MGLTVSQTTEGAAEQSEEESYLDESVTLRLPVDIWAEIFQYCDLPNLVAFSLTHSYWNVKVWDCLHVALLTFFPHI